MLKLQYLKNNNKPLILRDHLAAERTQLANERTFLAYIRTALTLFAAGVSFIKFFESALLEVVGSVFVPASLVLLVIGIWRFKKIEKAINDIENPPTLSTP